MSYAVQGLVMDVFPWPQGLGFSGSSAWWDYVLDKEDRQKLDHLLGMALLDPKISDLLVNKRDASLLEAFKLSQETQVWLRTIEASTLTELAQAIVSAT